MAWKTSWAYRTGENGGKKDNDKIKKSVQTSRACGLSILSCDFNSEYLSVGHSFIARREIYSDKFQTGESDKQHKVLTTHNSSIIRITDSKWDLCFLKHQENDCVSVFGLKDQVRYVIFVNFNSSEYGIRNIRQFKTYFDMYFTPDHSKIETSFRLVLFSSI